MILGFLLCGNDIDELYSNKAFVKSEKESLYINQYKCFNILFIKIR